MGVIAAWPRRAIRTDTLPQLAVYCAGALYILVLFLTVSHHEPWADEAQSWLLARDLSLAQLLAVAPHYEGTPPLWHLLLHLLIRLGLPYSALNIVSGALGVAAAWLIVRYAPLPLWIRLVLPFTYFLGYQYPVIARSYTLLPVLLLACAALYRQAANRLFPFTFLLCLLAAVSAHGFVLSLAIGVMFHVSVASGKKSLPDRDRRPFVVAAITYYVVLLLLAVLAWPAADGIFFAGPNLAPQHFFTVAGATLRDAFTGYTIPSGIIIALTLPFLRRGGTLLYFVLVSILLIGVNAIIYSNVWHYGVLFLSWLFAVWIAALTRKPTLPVLIALATVVTIQCSWTIASARYDWSHAYSGSHEAAGALHAAGIPRHQLLGIGFSSTSIQPYFSSNVFSNFNDGREQAYWDWSSRNRANDPLVLFSSPDTYVLAGYKAEAERDRWAALARLSGRERIGRFEGNVFWRNGILEPEAFDFYGPPAAGADLSAASTIKMSDPSASGQLLSGFYPIESDAWRWTAGTFALVLKRPEGAGGSGAKLILKLMIPEAQIKRLGTMTLRVNVDGHELPPEAYSRSGSYVFARQIASHALRNRLVPVRFRFDKFAPPSKSDSRELGAIVSLASLETNPGADQ